MIEIANIIANVFILGLGFCFASIGWILFVAGLLELIEKKRSHYGK